MSAILQSILLLNLCVGVDPGVDRRALVEQGLDQPTTLTIDDAPLHEAFDIIAKETGVGLSIGPEALAYLPYGEATRVGVRLANIRLREGIQVICDQLAMTYHTTSDGVELIPTDALQRLGRAATWDELRMMTTLMEMDWQGSESDIERLRSMVRFRDLAAAEEQWQALAERLGAAGAGRGDEVLTRACDALGLTWFPSSREIVILPAEAQIERQLGRPVSLRCNHCPLAEVLLNLSRQAGVSIKVDPAAAAELPDRAKQSFSLLAEGVTVGEALDQIGLATGLTYAIGANAITLRKPETGTVSMAARPASGRRDGSDRIVGKVIVPSADGQFHYEWMIRESDLTEEDNALRQELVDEAVRAMKADLRERR
jgi:hypothetical protein